MSTTLRQPLFCSTFFGFTLDLHEFLTSRTRTRRGRRGAHVGDAAPPRGHWGAHVVNPAPPQGLGEGVLDSQDAHVDNFAPVVVLQQVF